MAGERKNTGDSNPDPITGQPGSHPVGTGIGAASGGATGAAIGSVGGPVGTAVGAVTGAVVGGLIGKGVGEATDPTDDDAYYEQNFASRPYVKQGETYDTYRPAYQYGGTAGTRHEGRAFADVEPDLRSDWESTHGKTSGLPWDRARDAVRDAFDRTIQLREERLKVNKTSAEAGSVRVGKEVRTEHRTMEVPVEREEVVIERRPASGVAASADFRQEEIRVPVMEEQVNVSKEAFVTEEVSVGKRKVQDTETVGGTVRKEELKVEETGDVDVRDSGRAGRKS